MSDEDSVLRELRQVLEKPFKYRSSPSCLERRALPGEEGDFATSEARSLAGGVDCDPVFAAPGSRVTPTFDWEDPVDPWNLFIGNMLV